MIANPVIVNARSNTMNAARPPTSHVCGLGRNEMNAMIEYIATEMIAKIVKNCFIVLGLKVNKNRTGRGWSNPQSFLKYSQSKEFWICYACLLASSVTFRTM